VGHRSVITRCALSGITAAVVQVATDDAHLPGDPAGFSTTSACVRSQRGAVPEKWSQSLPCRTSCQSISFLKVVKAMGPVVDHLRGVETLSQDKIAPRSPPHRI
jgi:hypothetical protein